VTILLPGDSFNLDEKFYLILKKVEFDPNWFRSKVYDLSIQGIRGIRVSLHPEI